MENEKVRMIQMIEDSELYHNRETGYVNDQILMGEITVRYYIKQTDDSQELIKALIMSNTCSCGIITTPKEVTYRISFEIEKDLLNTLNT